MQKQEKALDNKRGTDDRREAWLEVLRVAATLAVVMLHTLTGAVDMEDPSLYQNGKGLLIVRDLVTWCVPVFLMISGYLFLNPEKKISYRIMLTRYCKRVALSLFVFGVPYACMEQIAVEGGFRPQMAGRAFLMVLQGKSWSHMWYLYLILFLYLITPFLKKVLETVPRRGILLAEGLLLLLSSLFPFLNILSGSEDLPQLPAWGIYLFYYIYGYLLVVGKRKNFCETSTAVSHYSPFFNKWMPGRKALRIILTCLVTAVCAGMAFSRISGGYRVQMPYNYPPAVLLSVLLMHLARINEENCRKIVGRKWEAFSAMSFTIYLIHPLFLNVLYKFLHIMPQDYPMALSLPVFWGVTVLLSAAGAWVLRGIPLLRRYVL